MTDEGHRKRSAMPSYNWCFYMMGYIQDTPEDTCHHTPQACGPSMNNVSKLLSEKLTCSRIPPLPLLIRRLPRRPSGVFTLRPKLAHGLTKENQLARPKQSRLWHPIISINSGLILLLHLQVKWEGKLRRTHGWTCEQPRCGIRSCVCSANS